MLAIRNVSKKFGSKYAVSDFSFEFGPGIYGILGPNGAGKTTLMKMMTGMLLPDKGDILYQGVSIYENPANLFLDLGYLPQSPLLYKDFRVEEFLDYMCELKDIPRGQRSGEINRVLADVNLSDQQKKKIGACSGGMRQRLGIAQALLGEPKILLLDEPTAGLDPIERIRFRNVISRISNDCTILITTHIVSDIEFIAHHIVIMNHGVVIRSANPKELCRSVTDKVWETSVDSSEIDQFVLRHKISSIRAGDHQYEVRIVGDRQPAQNAKNASPRLEEAYIYFLEKSEAEVALL